ncbi:mitochondrial dicarboxylate/tricarboxylate transporter DTC-like protein [Carex littledalei]|uniref:Mitochondrial dicarboxylate/tricarboxylate transporter DTC-like protein n=1 Tax=Carex littledalei TaxID=544730 RepID=A0A833QWG8_9POAL|nr:mitochondrial dicarboxylate/tricarboxylate transporter DTC-like protein [Carex littledalei]
MAEAEQQQLKSSVSVESTMKPFVTGAAQGMLATFTIHPFDTAKVRMQLGQGSFHQVTRNMLNGGIGSFYQAAEANEGKPLTLLQNIAIGVKAGAIGAFVSCPADLALIRMQADVTLPAAQQRHYKNVFHALLRIVADEGVLALWKGAGSTVVSAMALNMGMLALYDQSVELLRDSFGFGEVKSMFAAGAVSGIIASACSLPFDYVKTQIQAMQPDANGKYPYTGSLDCAMKTLKSGGPFKFYIGFRLVVYSSAAMVKCKRSKVELQGSYQRYQVYTNPDFTGTDTLRYVN